MASIRNSRLLVLFDQPVCSRCIRRNAASALRWSSTSTEAPASPLLAKIKNDLKSAMRAKDTSRLTVLRGTISEINQAASSPTPIKTDLQVLALLRKRKSATETAIKEAEAAKRPDLAEKQKKEMEVIDELVGSVKLMDPVALRTVVRGKIETLRKTTQGELKQGVVMKELLKPGGELDGKPLENKMLAELVREEILSNHNPL
ncbi:uncharacterized protein Z519_07881 [Cladophialophora bantiana CBS 173.52]|uniref:Altered inheritance of mitochondria protein 41 n=1 Tax=Cladophialophora bantiana (strain ATCC 10958 / CBS 173.52 / CDC B-1940 / NIH 8579) TaxID=1442370 RepID=A0A0D2EPL8_CLAB1|nr:uncharacterized protein Z519_07881 [Cladophialophora bantiana CBS 173.52]KIW91911.1 hypothetical protein Z519_07881 [Cladophialophora bantiana CBS 173.52]